MKFQKLRLLGFKSFVEPSELVIEPGLTGVVGPNGCGKSNLVEALRWVMGENSYKNMRAASMDEVIFSGSANRPARNTAEVTLFLDNLDRTAPAAFNDTDELQVSRRIEREAGSVYRINGREVRAKDVQLLFADASTGARSPSMIGQGRIGELISAKPRARRALLEEAAGISGLHSRRHEAELRLRAAETNLERIDDVIVQFDSQIDSLKRQARQANRFRSVSADIRKTGAMLFYLRWKAACEATALAKSNFASATLGVGQKAENQAGTARQQAVVAQRLPKLREAEAAAAAVLQRLNLARNQIDQEAEQVEAKKREIERRLEQLQDDMAREQQMVDENSDIIAHLDREETLLLKEAENNSEREKAAAERLGAAVEKLQQSEASQSDLTSEVALVQASRNQLQRTISDSSERHLRLSSQIDAVNDDLTEIAAEIARTAGTSNKQASVSALENDCNKAETLVIGAEKSTLTARASDEQARAPVIAARSELSQIETEARTLTQVLNASADDLFPAIVEQITVLPGMEAALGAALGEDLDASTEPSAPAHWGDCGSSDQDAPLPAGIAPLADKVSGPAELARRLNQIGIIERHQGDAMQALLKPGQRLVSIEGDLWRWDGFRASADAPTAAAQRLAQKNRLRELEETAIVAGQRLADAEQQAEIAQAGLAQCIEQEHHRRATARQLQQSLGQARDDLMKAERAAGELTNRRSALEEASVRLQSSLGECVEVKTEATHALAKIGDIEALEARLAKLQMEVAADRASFAELKADHDGLSRENSMRQQRLQTIGRERVSWRQRAANAESQIVKLQSRQQEVEAQQAQLDDAPDELQQRRQVLLSQISDAETLRHQAGDLLAKTENDLSVADRDASQALAALSEARELSARAEERLAATEERRSATEARIREELECQPHEVAQLAEIDTDKPAPEMDGIERRLERLKGERERLGAVNLRAEIERAELADQRDTLASESSDLIEAIARLRQGITSLNKEGRERLLGAFDQVNDQFQRLFTHLFGGGTAELQLVESDDPLDAGLEILARPPGKKPQTMTLLSGGEQALTALALIFAVFLTNPAPICVLDEVDAPLDDHNVERFCNLMDEMSASTDTRFMIITHNPITMARMNRLFGVTMAERGVSQLVSVNLETAENFRQSG